MESVLIRPVTPADAAAVLGVYSPYVLGASSTFEYDVPTLDDFTARIEKISAQYPYLVCEVDGQIVGYAYGSTHRERAGYRWCAEATVYLNETYHRRGIARVLYTALFTLMKEQGYHSIYVSILSTNESSVAFHRSMGFEDIGTFRNIGYKLGEWHSNIWMQLFLNEHHAAPALPLPITAITAREIFTQTLKTANEQIKMITLRYGNEIQL